MLSGIGPEEHLSSFGIKVLEDLPGVGKNLQDHASVLASFETKVRHHAHEAVARVSTGWRTEGVWGVGGRGKGDECYFFQLY